MTELITPPCDKCHSNVSQGGVVLHLTTCSQFPENVARAERRNFALLQAAATLYNQANLWSGISAPRAGLAVKEAEDILAEIESKEK